MGFDVDDFLDSTYRAVPRLLVAYLIRLRDQVWDLWFENRTLSEIIIGPTKEAPAGVANKSNGVTPPSEAKPILSAAGFYFLSLCFVLLLPVLIIGSSPFVRLTVPIGSSTGSSLFDRAVGVLLFGKEGEGLLALAGAGLVGLLVQATSNWILRRGFAAADRDTIHDALLLHGGAQLVVFLLVELVAFTPASLLGDALPEVAACISALYIVLMPLPLALKVGPIAKPVGSRWYFLPLFIIAVDLSLLAVIALSTLSYYEFTLTPHAYQLSIDRCRVDPTPDNPNSVSAVVVIENTSGHPLVFYGSELQLTLGSWRYVSDGPGEIQIFARPSAKVTMQSQQDADFPQVIDADESALFTLQVAASQEMKNLAKTHWNYAVGNLLCKVTALTDSDVAATRQATP
jgi:hypothetical protein